MPAERRRHRQTAEVISRAACLRPQDTPRTLPHSVVPLPSLVRVAKADLSFVICTRSLLISAIIVQFAPYNVRDLTFHFVFFKS
jgi:hypothetical protein